MTATPAKHARPHLETHTRSSGHSAIKGAAYRLGIRLTDERTGEAHDFRKRKLGEEIVRAVTIAPAGAPGWATNPQELWNRVEAAEKRKDAQVARDYRVPIPFGLTDEQAGDLAEEIARFISDQLNVPVSVGLHRDADRDALGNLKQNDKQGFHAHLYFPTRPLIVDGSDGSSGAAGSTGFGPKLTMLSNKNQSRAWVEQLNAKWAELANIHLSGAAKPAVIDHRSYVRQGVEAVPQPKMGVSATAMERKGRTTARGDVLREALVMAEVQRMARAAVGQAVTAGRDAREARATVKHRTASAASHEVVSAPSRIPVVAMKAPRTQRLVRTSAIPRETLAQRVAAAGPKPTNEAEQAALERSVMLVQILEGFLQTAVAQMKEHTQAVAQFQRRQSAVLDQLYRADQSRAEREKARLETQQMYELHPIRVRLANAGVPGITDPRVAVVARAARHDTHVQEAKRAARTLRVEADEALKSAQAAMVDLTLRKARLKGAVHDLAEHDPAALRQVLGFLPDEHGALVREAMGTVADARSDEGPDDAMAAPTVTPVLQPSTVNRTLRPV